MTTHGVPEPGPSAWAAGAVVTTSRDARAASKVAGMASADLRNGTRTRVSFDSSAPRQSTRKEPSGAGGGLGTPRCDLSPPQL